MNRHYARLALAALALAASSGCSGCGERAREVAVESQVQEAPEMLEIDPSLKPEFLRLDSPLLALAGDVDAGNHYLPAVMVTAVSGEAEEMWCSGAVLSPRVVLTAGHCVCARKQEPHPNGSQAIIDASACFGAAKVEAVFYTAAVEGGSSGGTRTKLHRGTVRAHPMLRVVLDGQGRVLSSHADLALIFLSKPLEVPGLPLADEEVRVGDSVIIVGYGYDEVARVFGSERRFSMNKVTRLMLPEDERVLIQQPRGHRYRQDSGGPCLRQGEKGRQLVGISNRWLGEGAAFTSIHGYRSWLRDEVRHADSIDSPQR